MCGGKFRTQACGVSTFCGVAEKANNSDKEPQVQTQEAWPGEGLPRPQSRELGASAGIERRSLISTVVFKAAEGSDKKITYFISWVYHQSSRVAQKEQLLGRGWG